MATIKGALRLEDIPCMNFGKYMLQVMTQFGDGQAIIDGSTGNFYTYEELINRTERLAAGLQKFGVHRGDVLSIVAPSHIEYHVIFYATTLINAILQALNPLFTKDDLKKLFKESDTQYVITVPEVLEKVKEAINDIDNIRVIVLGDVVGCTSFNSLLAPVGTRCKTHEAAWKSTTALQLYSSGTTGFPKAVELSHFALISNIIQISRAEDTDPSPAAAVSFVPMFHLTGLVVFGSVRHAMGYRLVFMQRFDFEEYLRLVEKYKPSRLTLVPPIMVLLAKHPKVSEYDLSCVKTISCGAAPLSNEIEQAVVKRMNLTNILQGYGMTEIGVTHYNTKDEFRHNSVGKLLELVEMKIVDVETGKTLETDQSGELWIRGPQVASGYRNLPEQTEELFLPDGWVKTGDIGKVDKDGFLYIVDRLKELIKYKGYQVAPASLEDILLRHHAVADVGVVGVPDEEAGELPIAYVVKKLGMHVSKKELQDFVADLVAPHMKLRGGVEFVSDIPRTVSGKILRKILRERARALQSYSNL